MQSYCKLETVQSKTLTFSLAGEETSKIAMYLLWLQRGRSNYYGMHFLVGEASPLCPARKNSA